MTIDDVKRSDLENTILAIAWTVLVLSGLLCLAVAFGSCDNIQSYSSAKRLEGWITVGYGLGVFASGFISWALLRAVAEILVLLKEGGTNSHASGGE